MKKILVLLAVTLVAVASLHFLFEGSVQPNYISPSAERVVSNVFTVEGESNETVTANTEESSADRREVANEDKLVSAPPVSSLSEIQEAVWRCFDSELLEIRRTAHCADLISDLIAIASETKDIQKFAYIVNILTTEMSSDDVDELVERFLLDNSSLSNVEKLDVRIAAAGPRSSEAAIDALYSNFFEMSVEEQQERVRHMVSASGSVMMNEDMRSAYEREARKLILSIERERGFANEYLAAGLDQKDLKFLESAGPEETERWMKANAEKWNSVEDQVSRKENGYVPVLEEYALTTLLSGSSGSADSILQEVLSKSDPYLAVYLIDEVRGVCDHGDQDNWCATFLNSSQLNDLLIAAAESDGYTDNDREVFSSYVR